MAVMMYLFQFILAWNPVNAFPQGHRNLALQIRSNYIDNAKTVSIDLSRFSAPIIYTSGFNFGRSRPSLRNTSPGRDVQSRYCSTMHDSSTFSLFHCIVPVSSMTVLVTSLSIPRTSRMEQQLQAGERIVVGIKRRCFPIRFSLYPPPDNAAICNRYIPQ